VLRSWGQWALAGLVPGIVCLVAVPLILYVIFPPEVKDTPDAPAKARRAAPVSRPRAPPVPGRAAAGRARHCTERAGCGTCGRRRRRRAPGARGPDGRTAAPGGRNFNIMRCCAAALHSALARATLRPRWAEHAPTAMPVTTADRVRVLKPIPRLTPRRAAPPQGGAEEAGAAVAGREAHGRRARPDGRAVDLRRPAGHRLGRGRAAGPGRAAHHQRGHLEGVPVRQPGARAAACGRAAPSVCVTPRGWPTAQTWWLADCDDPDLTLTCAWLIAADRLACLASCPLAGRT